MTPTNPTPGELADALQQVADTLSRLCDEARVGNGCWNESHALAAFRNIELLRAALDRTAGPVEWTEEDDRIWRVEQDEQAAYPQERMVWYHAKLRAFVAAQKGARS